VVSGRLIIREEETLTKPEPDLERLFLFTEEVLVDHCHITLKFLGIS